MEELHPDLEAIAANLLDDPPVTQKEIVAALLDERKRCARVVFQEFSPDQGERFDVRAILAYGRIRAPSSVDIQEQGKSDAS